MELVHTQKIPDPFHFTAVQQNTRVLGDDVGQRMTPGQVVFIQAFFQNLQFFLVGLQHGMEPVRSAAGMGN